MSDLDCPYCGAPFTVCHDDGHGYTEDVLHHDTCPSCKKHFVFETAISFHFTPHKAECLNGASHDWRPTGTTPVQLSRMICRSCGEEREPDADEWKRILAAEIQ